MRSRQAGPAQRPWAAPGKLATAQLGQLGRCPRGVSTLGVA